MKTETREEKLLKKYYNMYVCMGMSFMDIERKYNIPHSTVCWRMNNWGVRFWGHHTWEAFENAKQLHRRHKR